MEDSISEDFGQLSLNAISGTDSGEAVKLRALVKKSSDAHPSGQW